jgi:hypothetical protein
VAGPLNPNVVSDSILVIILALAVPHFPVDPFSSEVVAVAVRPLGLTVLSPLRVETAFINSPPAAGIDAHHLPAIDQSAL